MATVMAATAAERAVLEEEFRWLLHDEVHAVLRQLQDILKEASLRFTLPGSGTEGFTKQENFILGSCGPGEGRADSARGCTEPGGREPEDAQEQPAAALCLQGGQAVEAAADPGRQEPREPSHLPPCQPGGELPVQDRSRGPQADVRPRPAFRPAGQRLHQPQQALPHRVPAACPAAQFHQELPPSWRCRASQPRGHVRVGCTASGGEPRAQGGVCDPMAERCPRLLHRLPAALPAAQG
ncbi:protein rogdi homolog isoform X3 [Orcinus orca]|uniref:protein rogdi homolog isoform X3 n=1 Tax=Sagmatias obliquidens TaxID=3371155 RepID=UPI000F4456DA|nr:protein rogdi homolog isoform X3 [Lagenorhynchus obliquidens]XP_033284774.1 protein rogdi homolog isoform X3 [Orcinus orca]XP_059889015.1 protein rogdi homolog isoform X3 [Delphinus delphis]